SWTYAYGSNSNFALVRATEKAIDKWENVLQNKNLFTYSATSTNIIAFDDLESQRAGEETNYMLGSMVLGFTIFIDKDLDIEFLYPVAVHEIGHSLGLKHSLDENSAMYEYVNDVVNPTEIDIGMAQEVFTSCHLKFVQ
ncbi:MAG: matrixin family metalloprotease, partial [Candidatus Paceibacterota bacterium]